MCDGLSDCPMTESGGGGEEEEACEQGGGVLHYLCALLAGLGGV